ncbi:uncharacterized protein G2W53_010571 [Senna tora]|uniref:Uncharacterized protein n=1 Tax=Senna tora TaxID=362788 RepID=A0A835CE81_9FABA|nr:uncharacterized protein G2W53_010571 [Senna tora]
MNMSRIAEMLKNIGKEVWVGEHAMRERPLGPSEHLLLNDAFNSYGLMGHQQVDKEGHVLLDIRYI